MNTGGEDDDDDAIGAELEEYQRRLDHGRPVRQDEKNTIADLSPEALDKIDRAKRCLELMHQAAHRRSHPGSGEAHRDRLRLPRNVGRFAIESQLGMGGFGVVYLAYDPLTRRRVALKVPRIDALASKEALLRFQQEAAAAAKLDHPNLVPVLEAGMSGVLPYIASNYYAGPTLAHWLATHREHPIPPRDAASLVRQIALALQHAHDRGVLHRDVKPSNILLAPKETADPSTLNGYVPKLMDFGLARLSDSVDALTKSGAILGTIRYMAPEQAHGDQRAVTTAADVYSLGAALYELLAGQPPFNAASDLEALQQIDTRQPSRIRSIRPNTPVALDTISAKCLEKDPRRRYATAAELAEDLRRFLDGEPIHARAASALERLWLWARRRPAIASLIGVSSILLVAIFALSVWSNIRLLNERAATKAQRLRAEERELASRRLLYVADIKLAAQARENGHWEEAREILARQIPSPNQQEDLRAFEWRYLWNQCEERGARRWDAHDSEVYTVRFSPDHSTLASGGRDGTIRFWRPQDGQAVGEPFETGSEVNDLAFSSDGRFLASAHDDHAVRIWSNDKRTLESRLDGPREEVLCVAWSGQGDLIAAGAASGDVCFWKRRADAQGSVLTGHQQGVQGVVFSPDGRWLFSGGTDGEVWKWNVAERTGKAICKLNPVTAMAISPNGSIVAVGSQSGLVVCIDANIGEEIRRFGVSDGALAGVRFINDNLLAVGARDGVVSVNNSDRGSSVAAILDRRARLYGLDAVAGKQGLVAVGWSDAKISVTEVVMDAASVRSSNVVHERSVDALAIWEAGKEVLSVGRNHVQRTNYLTGTHSGEILIDGRLVGVAIDESRNRFAATSLDGLVTLGTLEPLAVTAKVELKGQTYISPAFSPDGRWLIVAIQDAIVAFDLSKTDHRVEVGRHGEDLTSLCFSSDGQWLASGAHDRLVRIWRTDGFQPVASIEIGMEIEQCLFYPSGAYLLVSDIKGNVYLVDVASKRIVTSVSSGSRSRSRIAISPDGQVVGVCGLGEVRFFSVPALEELGRIEVGAEPLTAITVDTTGRLWVAGGKDRRIYWFELPHALTLLTDTARSLAAGEVRSVAASRSGAMVIGGSPEVSGVYKFGQTERTTERETTTASHGACAAKADLAALLSPDGQIEIVDPQSSVVKTRFQIDDSHGIALSPDGHWLASTSGDSNAVRLWDTTSGTKARELTGHRMACQHATFTSSGRWIVSAATDGASNVWDVASGELVREYSHPGQRLARCAVSPEETVLAVGDELGVVTLWDMRTQSRTELNRKSRSKISDLDFSADGLTLAVCDGGGTVEFWNVPTSRLSLTVGLPFPATFLEFHPTDAACVVFSQGGKFIVIDAHGEHSSP